MEIHPKNYQLIILIILLFGTLQISAQLQYDARKEILDFSVSTGYSFGGPGNKLDNFLNSSGYNWELRTKNYLPLLFDIQKTISGRLGAGLNFCTFKQDLMWETYGRPNSSFGTIIISPYLSYTYKSIVSINAGPAINRVSFFHATGTSLEDDETHLKVGFILKSIIKYPKQTRLYLQLEALYSFGGTISPTYHIENSQRQYTYTTLHADNLPIDYFYAGMGLGIRFFRKTD